MKNMIALVTGGAGHIGRAICLKLASQGSQVAIVDKDITSTNSFLVELNEKYPGDHIAISANLLEENSFQEIFTRINDSFGRLDFLVNCAAFYDDTPGWGVGFEEESYDAWLKVLKVNTLAPFFLVQKMYTLLKNSENPSIVNISSIYGVVAPDFNLYKDLGMTNPAVYGVSKGGLQQMTKWLSSSLSPKIRVNTVTPGGVERGQNPDFQERYCSRTHLNRMAKEEDIANAVNFLLSTEAAYITGQNLIVDGGWTNC
jgi:NAD(P)-dependent dehydrogenase (short-subunit alcohol dehydrogenase family)